MMNRVYSPAEQEHLDHVAGSASEFQNCAAEAQHACSEESGRESEKINRALAAGRHVLDRQELQEANRLGRNARRGLLARAPILDVYFWQFASQPGRDLPALCKEWICGWDQQNLKNEA